jgi:hypothetical protein
MHLGFSPAVIASYLRPVGPGPRTFPPRRRPLGDARHDARTPHSAAHHAPKVPGPADRCLAEPNLTIETAGLPRPSRGRPAAMTAGLPTSST